jgi:hypothetical protein
MTQFKPPGHTDAYSNYEIPEKEEEGLYYDDNSESQ